MLDDKEQIKQLQIENKQLRSTVNELDSETTKRGLIIGEKDDKIIKLKKELNSMTEKRDFQIERTTNLINKILMLEDSHCKPKKIDGHYYCTCDCGLHKENGDY